MTKFVDWSKAPEEANYWTHDEDANRADWWKNKPELHESGRYWDFGGLIDSAPTFDFKGNWQDSLEERPHD